MVKADYQVTAGVDTAQHLKVQYHIIVMYVMKLL
jgi:hypothetical protein